MVTKALVISNYHSYDHSIALLLDKGPHLTGSLGPLFPFSKGGYFPKGGPILPVEWGAGGPILLVIWGPRAPGPHPTGRMGPGNLGGLHFTLTLAGSHVFRVTSLGFSRGFWLSRVT